MRRVIACWLSSGVGAAKRWAKLGARGEAVHHQVGELFQQLVEGSGGGSGFLRNVGQAAGQANPAAGSEGDDRTLLDIAGQ